MIKAKLSTGALALALLLTGCGGGEANLAANEMGPPQLTQIPAPNNGDWTQVVNQTAEGGWVMGNPDAPVKLVEYGSMTCPACRAFSENATAALRDTYVRSGQVSWEFRHLVIHGAPDVALAMLSDCQGAAGFFPTMEQIYNQQPEILERYQNAAQTVAALPPEGLVLSSIVAERLSVVAFEHLGSGLVRLDHHVVGLPVLVAQLGLGRLAVAGGAQGHHRFSSDEGELRDRGGLVAR